MFGLEYGLLGAIFLVLFLWASFHIIGSETSPLGKALWIAALLLLPMAGFIVWFFLGPRAIRSAP